MDRRSGCGACCIAPQFRRRYPNAEWQADEYQMRAAFEDNFAPYLCPPLRPCSSGLQPTGDVFNDPEEAIIYFAEPSRKPTGES